jgi:hypothetical protein
MEAQASQLDLAGDMTRFQLLYEGERHDLDAKVLLESVGNVTALLTAINQELGDDRELRVRVAAPERGSFSIDLELIRDLATLVAEHGSDIITYTETILSLLVGLFSLREFLGSDDPEEIETTAGTTTVTRQDGDELEIDSTVWNLYTSDDDVTDLIIGTFKALSEDDHIEGFTITDPETENVRFRAERGEFDRLAGKKKEPTPETRTRLEKNVQLTVVRVVFDPDRRWEFLWRGESISATLEDPGFWYRVNQGEESFRKGDRLVVDLARDQEYDPNVRDWKTKDHRVETVRDHISRNEQGDLFPDE